MVEDLLKWMEKKKVRRCTPRDLCRSRFCGITKSSDAEKLLQAAIDRGLGEGEGPDHRRGRGRRGPDLQAFVLKVEG